MIGSIIRQSQLGFNGVYNLEDSISRNNFIGYRGNVLCVMNTTSLTHRFISVPDFKVWALPTQSPFSANGAFLQNKAVFSPNLKWFAGGLPASPRVAVIDTNNSWSTNINKLQTALPGNANFVTWSKDGTKLCAGCNSGTNNLRVWTVNNSSSTWSDAFNYTHGGNLYAAAFSDDGSQLVFGGAVGSSSKYVRRINTSDWSEVAAAFDSTEPGSEISDIDWYENGGQICFALKSSPYMHRYDTNSGGEWLYITESATMPTGQALASKYNHNHCAITANGRLEVYKVTDGTRLTMATQPGSGSNSFAYSLDGNYCAVGKASGLVIYSISGDTYTAMTIPSTVAQADRQYGLQWLYI